MSASAPTTTTLEGRSMHPQKRTLLWINLLGGVAVLGSYAHGLLTHPETSGELWGGVPDALRPVYTLNMLLAAAGYFLFSFFVFFRLDPDRVRVGSLGFGLFNALYAAILLPSALWLPLTFEMLAVPGALLWLAIRAGLLVTGVASLGLLLVIARVEPHEAPWARRLALLGTTFFTLQTLLLDALIWPAYFPG